MILLPSQLCSYVSAMLRSTDFEGTGRITVAKLCDQLEESRLGLNRCPDGTRPSPLSNFFLCKQGSSACAAGDPSRAHRRGRSLLRREHSIVRHHSQAPAQQPTRMAEAARGPRPKPPAFSLIAPSPTSAGATRSRHRVGLGAFLRHTQRLHA